jgi:tRNA-dihydrouridine synthase A
MDQAPNDVSASPWRFCVAPMMEWTDRHCRYFHRTLTRHARLYTEMVTTGPLLHGDAARHLDFDAAELPVALQLGGADPGELARCARLGERAGYAEINLNCGCPSGRVQQGAFGACLMSRPADVAACVAAMQDAVSIPVTVKHRIGLDHDSSDALVLDFVGALREAGVRVFIIHARNAWLHGLSPRENREVPPLRYDAVDRIRSAFPAATIVINGGIASLDDAGNHLERVDGVMLGRAAYHGPMLLGDVDRRFFPWDEQGSATDARSTLDRVIEAMSAYLEREEARGAPIRSIVRHMLGLPGGARGARTWRRSLSDPLFLDRHRADSLRAAAAVAGLAGGARDAAITQLAA